MEMSTIMDVKISCEIKVKVKIGKKDILYLNQKMITSLLKVLKKRFQI